MIVSDCSKFGRQGLVRVCGFESIDLLITDAAPTGAVADALAAAGVTTEIAAPVRAAA